jgi:hypothetical protein
MNALAKASESELQKQTKDYKKLLKDLVSPDKLSSTLKCYIRDLLPLEMTWVQTQRPLLESLCDTLVLLVGYSLEPILQSICFYQPCENIVLVLNKKYGNGYGYTMGNTLESLVGDLKKQAAYRSSEPLLRTNPTIGPKKQGVFMEVEDTPTAVFQHLLTTLHASPSKNIVIDITGAKKSMVAGAFLYAAFANVPISYVAFDDTNYDLISGRPEGYRSRIERLINPYTFFALQEWLRLHTFYQHYRFQDAYELLLGKTGEGGSGTILEATRSSQPTAEPLLKKVGQMLKCYQHWEAGDLKAAAQEAEYIAGFAPPTAVSLLGPDWYEFEDTTIKHTPTHFYDDNLRLRVYVADECARIQRLIQYNQDYRSAFLRAGGVNEVVMVSRLVRAASDPTVKTALLNALDKGTPSASSLFKKLQQPPGSTITVSFRDGNKLSFQQMQKMDLWWDKMGFSIQDNKNEFLDIRNKLAHTYASVTKELAEAGLAFATANFENFISNHVSSLCVTTEVMPWSELCRFCGLETILTPNLLQDDKEE